MNHCSLKGTLACSFRRLTFPVFLISAMMLLSCIRNDSNHERPPDEALARESLVNANKQLLTNEESQILESSAGPLPSRTKVWAHVVEAAKADPYKTEVLAAFQETGSTAFAVPATPYWIEATNLIYPELQAAIVGDKTIDEALQTASDAVDGLMRENGVY